MPRVKQGAGSPSESGKFFVSELLPHAPGAAIRLALRGALRAVHRIQRAPGCAEAMHAYQNASSMLGVAFGVQASHPEVSQAVVSRAYQTIGRAANEAVVAACSIDMSAERRGSTIRFPPSLRGRK